MNARSYTELVQRALLSSPLLLSLLLSSLLFSSLLLTSPHRALTSCGFVTRVSLSLSLSLSPLSIFLSLSRSKCTIHRTRYVYIASEIPYLGKDARWKRRIKPDVNGVIEFSRHPRPHVGATTCLK